MRAPLGQLAARFGAKLLGDPDTVITGASTITNANSGDITFCESLRFQEQLRRSAASAVLVTEPMEGAPLAQLVSDNPREIFAELVAEFHPRHLERIVGVSEDAIIDPQSRLGDHVHVAAGCYVGPDVEIGDRCVLHAGVRLLAGSKVGQDTVLFPNVVCYENTYIGQRCRIHAGAVLGADGFGFSLEQGAWKAARQLGWVEVGNDVEIGANTTIDRGTYGPTTIGDGTKIDNLVMIGHNCHVGRHNLLCSQVGIAGSTSTGEYVVLAGQVGVKDHVHIGDAARIGAQSGIAGDVEPQSAYFGTPALPAARAHRIDKILAKLPELRSELRELKRAVARLEAEQDVHGQDGTPSADAA